MLRRIKQSDSQSIKQVLLAGFLALFSVTSTFATIRYVDYNGGADSGDGTSAPGWKTLAYAVSTADAGDEIILAKGTHVIASDIAIDKALDIHGAGEMDETILDAKHVKYTITISAEGATISRLQFYQLGGYSYHQGFVVLSGNSTIADCRFKGCGYEKSQYSFTIVKASAGLISRCYFTENRGDGSLGIYFPSGNAVVENCVFMNNVITSGGLSGKGFLYFNTNDAIARNCTIVNNTMCADGAVYAGAWTSAEGFVDGRLYNCIVYNNCDSSGAQKNWYTRGLSNKSTCKWIGNCMYPLKGTGSTTGSAANNVEDDPQLDSDGKPTLATPATVKTGASVGTDYLAATDILGVSRGTTPSRGAYQYVPKTDLSVVVEASPTEVRLPATIALSAQVEGAQGDLTYAWDFNNDGTTDSTESAPKLATVGTYSELSVTVNDGTNTKKATYDGTLTVLQRYMTNVVVSADKTAVRYPGKITLTATIGDVDAVGPFVYSWDLDGDGEEDCKDEHPVFEEIGSYVNPTLLSVTDANGLYTGEKVVLKGTYIIHPEKPQAHTVNVGDSIADAIASAFDGDEVVLAKGTHPVTSVIQVNRPITVRGEGGKEETILDANYGGAKTQFYHFDILSAGAKVCNLTFDRFGHSGNSGYVRIYADAVVSNVVVRNGSCGWNQGAFVDMKAGLLTHSWITNNAAGKCAGVQMVGSSTVENCAILGNCSTGTTKDHYTGAVISILDGSGIRTVRNCTIANNTFAYTNNTAAYSYCWNGAGFVHFYNNIIWSNTCTQAGAPHPNARNNYNKKWIVKNNCWDYNDMGRMQDPNNGTNVCTVNADPKFDAVKGAPWLSADSPCKNAGDDDYAPTGLDLLGKPRKVGKSVDIGAVEYQGLGLMLLLR